VLGGKSCCYYQDEIGVLTLPFSFLGRLTTLPLRHLAILAGSVALSAGPALAADPTSFTVLLDGQSSNTPPTGVKGELIFSFAPTANSSTTTGNDVKLTLTLKNTSTTPPIDTSRFVAAAFTVPDGISYISNSYDGGSRFDTIYQDPNADIQPFGDVAPPPQSYDICIRATSQGNGTCNGGGSGQGLLNGETYSVTLDFNSTSFSTAEQFKTAFLSASTPPSPPINNVGPVAGRFQSINCTGNLSCALGASDKILGGTPGGPPGGPGTSSVPGPLPIFGAAAAFGYSRKLRQRLKAQAMI